LIEKRPTPTPTMAVIVFAALAGSSSGHVRDATAVVIGQPVAVAAVVVVVAALMATWRWTLGRVCRQMCRLQARQLVR
jgi:hypothetical protein